jgi:hypothetical protein
MEIVLPGLPTTRAKNADATNSRLAGGHDVCVAPRISTGTNRTASAGPTRLATVSMAERCGFEPRQSGR